MASRPELEKYLNQDILITADILARKDNGKGRYGFLLKDVNLPSGETVDHVWFNVDCLDLAAVSGATIKATATVSEYWKAGRIDGRYEECCERGVGFSCLSDVHVQNSEDWIALEQAATENRKANAKNIKDQKANGTYSWPGTWSYRPGSLCVKAAKSAKPGARCAVSSRSGFDDREVILTEQVLPGFWKFVEGIGG